MQCNFGALPVLNSRQNKTGICLFSENAFLHSLWLGKQGITVLKQDVTSNVSTPPETACVFLCVAGGVQPKVRLGPHPYKTLA
jgi:hypothetical protein